MAKKALTDIDSGEEAWDAPLNDNLGILRDGPLPIASFANVGALPAANQNDEALAIVLSPFGLYVSDGSTWVNLLSAGAALDEIIVPGRNNSGSSISSYRAATIVGDYATESIPLVKRIDAEEQVPFGIPKTSVGNNSTGEFVLRGRLSNSQLPNGAAGDLVFVNPADGLLTNTPSTICVGVQLGIDLVWFDPTIFYGVGTSFGEHGVGQAQSNLDAGDVVRINGVASGIPRLVAGTNNHQDAPVGLMVESLSINTNGRFLRRGVLTDASVPTGSQNDPVYTDPQGALTTSRTPFQVGKLLASGILYFDPAQFGQLDKGGVSEFATFRNESGAQLDAGKVVAASDDAPPFGNYAAVEALNDYAQTPLGIVLENLASNGQGSILTRGRVTGGPTGSQGDAVYVDDSGDLTTTRTVLQVGELLASGIVYFDPASYLHKGLQATSTSEVETGRDDAGGNRIYRKTFQIVGLANAGTDSTAHGAGLSMAKGRHLLVQAMAQDGTTARVLPWTDGTDRLEVTVDATNINVISTKDETATDVYLVLEYTK